MLATPVAWLPAWSVRAALAPVAPPRASPRLPPCASPRLLRSRSVRASANELTVSTFNLWCPAYRRVDGDEEVREAEFPELYMPRHREILGLDVWNTSDIVCCQEFWFGSQDVFDLYVNTLQPCFKMHGLGFGLDAAASEAPRGYGTGKRAAAYNKVAPEPSETPVEPYDGKGE